MNNGLPNLRLEPFCCCLRQGRDEREREREVKSDQINICCLNSPFKVNMDFYHIKPKPMSQRFCAWILLANRKIILSDGRLRVLFVAGARQAAVRLQGEL